MKNRNFIIDKPFTYQKEFLKSYKDIFDIDIDKSIKIIKETKQFYDGKLDYGYAKNLQLQWYNSLYKNHIDYSVYDDFYYFTDLWCCWQMYSRSYILSILKNNLFKDCKVIVDLGCGLGLTTSLLKQIFPNSRVIGTNLKNTKQYKYCEYLSKLYNFELVEEKDLPNNVDLIFASEYFEHIEDATDNIKKLIKLTNAKNFYLANSFNTLSVGHFHKYKYFVGWKVFDDGKIPIYSLYDEKEVSRKFNQVLKDSGYKKIKTNNWNNKPALWSLS